MSTTYASVKRGFTLIELLVVIAIIAILAAILFPVFAQAKIAAKKAVDISNMKQIMLSVLMYENDYDDVPPQISWEVAPSIGGPIPWDTGGFQIHFTYNLQPYVKNYAIFQNPMDTNPVLPSNPCPNGTADFGKLNSSGQQYCDWQYPNSYLPAYNVLPAHDWLPVPSTTYPNPAGLISITDRRNYSEGPPHVKYSDKKGLSGFNPSQPCTQEGATMVPPTQTILPTGLSYAFWTEPFIQYWQINATSDDPDVDRVWYDLYGNGSNYAFADGHVKFQPLGATLIPQLGSYEYGDTFYPSINPQDGTCLGGG
jgi:prepilin-type N-terminal cleavage/methylation domain-containing protein/prepilin-type processing-associated H-X9-DG protein